MGRFRISFPFKQLICSEFCHGAPCCVLGLQNGVLLRTVLDQVTGDLSDTRTRYIGSRPVKLFRVSMQGGEAVLAMSSRTWITYYHQNR